MYFRIMSVLFIGISFLLSSCATKHSDIIVAKYGKDKITLGEFEQVYAKNAGGIDAAKKDSIDRLRNFLELYVNFKMKLNDAELRGFTRNPILDAELKDYKEKVGLSYLLEKEVVEPGVKSLYDKRKYEIRVSHLMLRPDTSADEKNKKLAIALIDSINKGSKFEDLVKRYSADFYSKNDGGDIYYISAGMIIPEFEDAAYQTEVGKIYPEPVKTRYGYHIIKVTEKRERIPEIRASHILISFKRDSSKVDTVSALAIIKDVKKQLDNGADFTELAKKYSEDPGSKDKGGDLGFFERRSMVKPFDEAAFNLQVGQVSGIVRTNFGYHLIKVTDKKTSSSFEEDKDELKKLFKKTRYDLAYAEYVKKLEDKYNLKVNENVINIVASNPDTSRMGPEYLSSNWRANVKDSVIYTLNNKSVTVDSLMAKVGTMQEFDNKVINKKVVSDAVKRDADNSALLLQVMKLDGTDTQFTQLMDEYRNGIYIFKLQEEEVWNKIKADSAKIYEFYTAKLKFLSDSVNTKNNPEFRAIKNKLVLPDRVTFMEIYSKKDSLINFYYTQVEKGLDFKTLASNTERAGYKEKSGRYDSLDVNSNQLAKEANALQKAGDVSKPFKNGAGYSIVKLIERIPSRVKTFEEAKAEISGLYQEAEAKRLENEYVTSLKGSYKPVIFYDKVEQAFKSN